jgi:hypothetical protein
MTVTGRYLWAGNGADPRKPLADLPQLIQAEIREGHSRFLEDIPVWLRVLCAMPSVAYAATLILGAVLVARILRTIARGDAFAVQVRRTLVALSLTLVGGGLVAGLLDTAALGTVIGLSSGATLDDGSPFDPMVVSVLGTDLPHWPIMLIVLGVVASALTLAFREGARLREELVGVV